MLSEHANSSMSTSSETTNPNHKALLPETLTKLTPSPDEYFIDQLKNGILLKKQPLSQNRIVFGRARDCDIILEHPSISRYHAALLWTPKNEINYENGSNKESFWYLIDCGSTHGTICNKTKIEAGKMIKLSPNNNVFKFGASTRFFILGSNNEQQENDEQEIPSTYSNETKESTEINEDVCTWGMKLTDCDDDNEETGDSIALKSIVSAMKNGDHTILSPNENAFSDNPYKCLQLWFEREGQDFDYKVDCHNGKFKCTFEIPIDHQWIPIEGSPMNKKKDAISDACLKCCKILDQSLLLFPWQKQNAQKERNEEYMENEKELLDETVKVNKKLKLDNNVSIENYDTLNAKWKDINDQLCKLKVKLATIGMEAGVKPEINDNLTDSLDIYLANMNKGKYGLTLNEKIEKSNIKIQIKQLEQEQNRIEKLITIAKPSVVLPFKPPTNNNSEKNVNLPQENSAEIICDKQQPPLKLDVPKSDHSEIVCSKSEQNIELQTNHNFTMPAPKSTKVSKSKESAKTIRKMRQESIIKAIEKEKQLEKKKAATALVENDSDFVDWLPPTNQLGDGKTSLNDKYGY